MDQIQGRSPRLLGQPRPGLRRLRTRPRQPQGQRPPAARKRLRRARALRQDGEGDRARGPKVGGRERGLRRLPRDGEAARSQEGDHRGAREAGPDRAGDGEQRGVGGGGRGRDERAPGAGALLRRADLLRGQGRGGHVRVPALRQRVRLHPRGVRGREGRGRARGRPRSGSTLRRGWRSASRPRW